MATLTGFKDQMAFFARAIARGELAHAYLFAGPAMIGKRSFALEVFEAAAGRVLGAGGDPDLMVLAGSPSGQASISIQEVREAASWMVRTPMQGPKKFLVIDDAERMTLEAANALLKILEEPPSYAVLILVSAQDQLVIPTIRSRCQEVRFAAHPPQAVHAALAAQPLSESDREFIVLMAGGRLGWALGAVASGSWRTLKRDIEDLQRVSREPIAARLAYAKTLADREDCPEVVEGWLRWGASRAGSSERSPRFTELIHLSHLVRHSQFNHRVAIERFLVGL